MRRPDEVVDATREASRGGAARRDAVRRPDVRAAVDAAIRSHLDSRRPASPAGGSRPTASPPRVDGPGRLANACRDAADGVGPTAPPNERGHALFPRAVLPGDPAAGRCVIQPEVECVGSGYCRSHGH